MKILVLPSERRISAKRKLTELEGSEELNAHQYRQVMMGYREAREFLKELIGIFENSDSINQIKI